MTVAGLNTLDAIIRDMEWHGTEYTAKRIKMSDRGNEGR